MPETWKERKARGLTKAASAISPIRYLIEGTPLDPVLKAEVDKEEAKNDPPR